MKPNRTANWPGNGGGSDGDDHFPITTFPLSTLWQIWIDQPTNQTRQAARSIESKKVVGCRRRRHWHRNLPSFFIQFPLLYSHHMDQPTDWQPFLPFPSPSFPLSNSKVIQLFVAVSVLPKWMKANSQLSPLLLRSRNKFISIEHSQTWE